MSIANEASTGGTEPTPQQGHRDLRQTAQNVKDSVSETAGQVRERAAAMFETGKEKAQQYLQQGRESASEYLHEGADKAKEFEQQVEQYIRQKPIQSVLMAVGVGVVLGALLKR